MEVAGLCGAHMDCLDQASLEPIEVNVVVSGWALVSAETAALLDVPSLIVFSSEMSELAKSSEMSFG